GPLAAYLPTLPEARAAALESAIVGAIWSSCSPDFGVQGVLDRFGQIEPRVLFAADGYFYNGKTVDVLPRLAEVAAQLPSVEKVIVVPYTQPRPRISHIRRAINVHDLMAPHRPREIRFERFAFDHPLYILYSSGTTRAP